VLVSWQLSLTLDTIVPYAIPLTHAIFADQHCQSLRDHLLPGRCAGLGAVLPRNTLFNVSGPSLNLLFNQSILPTGNGARALGDYPLLTGGDRYGDRGF